MNSTHIHYTIGAFYCTGFLLLIICLCVWRTEVGKNWRRKNPRQTKNDNRAGTEAAILEIEDSDSNSSVSEVPNEENIEQPSVLK